jgi:hypothetical protein
MPLDVVRLARFRNQEAQTPEDRAARCSFAQLATRFYRSAPESERGHRGLCRAPQSWPPAGAGGLDACELIEVMRPAPIGLQAAG